MRLQSKKILDISITTDTKETILQYMRNRLSGWGKKSAKTTIIYTPNPEQVVYAHDNLWFGKLLNKADVTVPDGVGVARVLGIPPVPGVDFMQTLVSVASEKAYCVGLMGGSGNVAVEALECLRETHRLDGWAESGRTFSVVSHQLSVEDGDVEAYINSIAKKVVETETRMVFVALGAPKQELFVDALAKKLEKTAKKHVVLMVVGGAFDMIAGRTARAPGIMRHTGLEWLWRLARQPWRIKRQMNLLRYLYLLGKYNR